jgi:hypothetical protein
MRFLFKLKERVLLVDLVLTMLETKVTCTTEELARLNQRNKESLEEIMSLTSKVLTNLCSEVRKNMSTICSQANIQMYCIG